ncbi:MAG: SEC-C domain-containing protein [Clostridia bacterium]|nr:SEC-C domain-containing protein [Clostridia bacterium]
MLRISDEERAEQRMHDMLAAVMDGWLMHVGMMPLQELLHRTAMLLEPEPEEITDVEQLCFAILIARMGPGAIYVDEEDAAWAVSEELEDPDALWKRLQEPHIATLPYPDFCVEDLLFSALETLLPGDIELYGPLLDWLEAHEAEDIDDLLNELVWLCQNTRERETPECLLSCVKTKDIDDANNGVRAMYGLFNALPHWSNKGHSPNELIERTRGQRKAPAMPGRNDRCPCGSGKKYKQCCGRLMN